MKILQVHNYYQQPGGEDAVVAAERSLLQSHGHEVIQYEKHNDSVGDVSRLRLFQQTIFNFETHREIALLLEQEAPDLIHSHNTLPLISPSVYYAASKAGIPIIQTLHNFRLLCPSATLFREGRICEECLGRVPYPGVLHACYRGDRGASAAIAAMIVAHRAVGTWREKIRTFIALSLFSRSKFIEGGLPADKIAVKSNFVLDDPGTGSGDGEYVLFSGRLAREKGLGVLLDAWQQLRTPITLRIAGDGELMPWLRERVKGLSNVAILGYQPRSVILDFVKRATLLIAPSEWYEAGLPLTAIEALACGTPIMMTTLRSMDGLIQDGLEGCRFNTGSAVDLAQKLERIWKSPDLRTGMRIAARAAYERQFTAAINYSQLMQIYGSAIKEAE